MTLLEQDPRWEITSDEVLGELWSSLMGEGGFGRRGLWLLFVDGDGWTLPLLMPVDDIPARPSGPETRGLFDLVELVREETTAATFAALLSRPGPPGKTADDRAWAAELTRLARSRGVPMWPVHLATYERVQRMAPDDLIGA